MSADADAPEGTSELLAVIARYEAAERALNERIREAHAVTREARLATKDVERAEAQLRATIVEATSATVRELIQPYMDVLGADLSQQFTTLVNEARRNAIKTMRAAIEEMWKDQNGVDVRDVVGAWKEALALGPPKLPNKKKGDIRNAE